jgi:hypothetical protein
MLTMAMDGSGVARCGRMAMRGSDHLLFSTGDQLGRRGSELGTQLDVVIEEGVLGHLL